jgi:hypothetical protein
LTKVLTCEYCKQHHKESPTHDGYHSSEHIYFSFKKKMFSNKKIKNKNEIKKLGDGVQLTGGLLS